MKCEGCAPFVAAAASGAVAHHQRPPCRDVCGRSSDDARAGIRSRALDDAVARIAGLPAVRGDAEGSWTIAGVAEGGPCPGQEIIEQYDKDKYEKHDTENALSRRQLRRRER